MLQGATVISAAGGRAIGCAHVRVDHRHSIILQPTHHIVACLATGRVHSCPVSMEVSQYYRPKWRFPGGPEWGTPHFQAIPPCATWVHFSWQIRVHTCNGQERLHLHSCLRYPGHPCCWMAAVEGLLRAACARRLGIHAVEDRWTITR